MKKNIYLSVPITAFLFFSFLLLSFFANAQSGGLSGKVTDPEGNALIGVSVQIKGTNQVTKTNESGIFTFEKVARLYVSLNLSYVGYNSQLVKAAANQKELTVTMEPFVAQGDEIVVTGVFDKRKKMDASVAISTLSSKEIAKLVPVSAADLIRNIPGVYVNSSLGEIRNTVYSRGVSPGSSDGATGYYYVSLQEDGLPITNATFGNYGPDYFLRADATLGRLEGVRGGTASITGSNAPGGIFNYISKEGGAKFAGEFRAKYGLEGDGRFPFHRADINIGGPLAKNLYYNIGGFYRYAQGARDPGYPLNYGGQLKGNIVKKYKGGSLKLTAKYLNDHNGTFEFTPTVGFSNPKPAPNFSRYSSVLIQPVTQSFTINEDRTNTDIFDSKNLIHSLDRSIGLNWEHRFGKGWTVSNNMRYSDKESKWNTTSLVVPFAVDDFLSYAAIGAISATGVNFGTYRFSNATTGQEYGKTMLLPRIDPTTGAFLGFNIPVLSSNFPGKEVLPNSLFFNPLYYTKNQVKEFINQFSINKKLKNMSFTAGAFYGSSKIYNIGGLIGNAFGTLENKPALINIEYTDFGGKTYQVTNSQGVAVVGSTGLGVKEATQKQLALFFGHNWQLTSKLNLDYGARYENVGVNGHNAVNHIVPRAPGYGGIDGNPFTLYDNAGGTIRKDSLNYGYDKSINTFSLSAGLNYKISNTFAVYGRYSDGKKSPDLGFFFNIDAPGEDALKPQSQRVQQMEAGVKLKMGNLNLFATPFYSVLSNVPEQQFAQNPNQSFYSTPVLLNKYRTYGIELEGDYTFAKYFNFHGVATFQQSKAIDYRVWVLNAPGAADDKALDNSGRATDNSANVIMNNTLSYNRSKFNTNLVWSYMGARQANVVNAFQLPAFSQFHLSAGYDFTKRFQLTLNINNLTNVYGVMGWTRPGGLFNALDRQGFTPDMLKANPNVVYQTLAVPARAYFLTAAFKF